MKKEAKTYSINMCSGEAIVVTAELATYDQAGNLIFMNETSAEKTEENPEGEAYELVRCFNSRHYTSYGHAKN